MEPAKTIPVILGTLVMVVGAAALWWKVGSGGDADLHVYFFDVGQGDSALIVDRMAARYWWMAAMVRTAQYRH